MKCNIKFDNIAPTERVKWRTAICSAIKSLPKDERKVIPDIHLYPTVIKSLIMNFDVNDAHTDEVAEQFFKNSAWAYSKLRGTKKNKFISFSIKRFNSLKEFVTPEFTIFHEIGHFQLCERLKEILTSTNMKTIELKCDRYGLFALTRMLYYKPHYKTISTFKKHIDFENNMRKLINQVITEKEITKDNLRHKFAEVSDMIMKLMNWEDIYEQ